LVVNIYFHHMQASVNGRAYMLIKVQ